MPSLGNQGQTSSINERKLINLGLETVIPYVQTIDDYASVPYLYSQLYTLLLLLNLNSLVYLYTHSFQLIRVVARKTVERPHVGRHLPRPAQARVAPAQGENGASPLRK